MSTYSGDTPSTDLKRELMRRLPAYIDELYQKPRLRNLFWEATTQCNLSCKHCGSDCRTDIPVDSISGEEMRTFFTRFAEDFSPNEVMIHITGGEPLLRSDLFEVMEHAARLGFIWGMTTNGTLLTDSIIREMIRTNCRTISVSIDGLRQSHNTLRGDDCFDKAVESTKKLIGAKGFSEVQVTTVVHKSNISELPDIYTLLESLEVDSWRLTNIEPIGRASQMEGEFLSANEFVKLFDFIRMFRQSRSKIPVSFGCSHYATPEYERDIRDHYFFCGAGIITASILHNGDIFACPDIGRRSELIQGNIRTDDFAAVWQNQFRPFRRRRDLQSSACVDCVYAYFCRGDSAHTWDFEKNMPKCCLKEAFVALEATKR